MGKVKFNELDLELIKKIKSSIANSDGKNWKQQWKCHGMPINGISGKEFSGKTEFNLFLVTNELASKGIKGNRWFTIGKVKQYNLWKHEYKYSFKDKDGVVTSIKRDPDFPDAKDGKSHWLKKVGNAPTYDKITVNDTEKNYIASLKNQGYVGELIRQEPLAVADSPFFRISYQDPVSNKRVDYEIEFKDRLRTVVYASELDSVFKALKAKGVDPKKIYIHFSGKTITRLYHESQLSQKALEKIHTPIQKSNNSLKLIDKSNITDIAGAIKLKSITFDDIKSQGQAYYDRGNDKVVLPSETSFKSKEALFATSFHELVHATGHESRTNREFGTFGSEKYAKEELVAEIGSIFLCNKYGIDSDKQMQNHGEYIKNWVQAIDEKDDAQNKAILSAVCQASKAFKYINDSLNHSLDKEMNLNKSEINNGDGPDL